MNDLKLDESSDNETDSLVRVVKNLSYNIGMRFGFEKCAVLNM